jgi:transposase-like protein
MDNVHLDRSDTRPPVELAEHFDVHLNQISEWKQQLTESAASL